jgi:hypothetical protein
VSIPVLDIEMVHGLADLVVDAVRATAGCARLHVALAAGDPNDEVRACWVAKEKVRDVYAIDDVGLATERLDDAIASAMSKLSA